MRGNNVPSSLEFQASTLARLVLVGAITLGFVLVGAAFAARGVAATDIALPALLAAWLAAWLGVAWALRSWVAVLLTFVPSLMLVLGVAMLSDGAPAPGTVLAVLGGTMLLAIAWSRVSRPTRRWTPGWSAPSTDRPASPSTGRPTVPDMPGSAGPPPSWDTSRTDVTARDALILRTCHRGGTMGPTLTTLEDFFTGNGDGRSIAPPLRASVPLPTFARVLRALRQRDDVAEVLIQLDPLESGEYPAGRWPVAGSVCVVAALDPAELDGAVAELHPENILGPLPIERLTDGRPAPPGMAEFAVLWS